MGGSYFELAYSAVSEERMTSILGVTGRKACVNYMGRFYGVLEGMKGYGVCTKAMGLQSMKNDPF
jgi:hypothetical protein